MKSILLTTITLTTLISGFDRSYSDDDHSDGSWVITKSTRDASSSSSHSPSLDPCDYPDLSPQLSAIRKKSPSTSPNPRITAAVLQTVSVPNTTDTRHNSSPIGNDRGSTTSSDGTRIIRPRPSPDAPLVQIPLTGLAKVGMRASRTPSPSSSESSSTASETTPLLKRQGQRQYASIHRAPQLPKAPRDRSCCGTFAAFCASLFSGDGS